MRSLDGGPREGIVSTRQAKTEERVDALTASMALVTAAVTDLTATVNKGFSDLHERISAHTRTNWPVIWGGMAVGLAIIGLYLQGPISTLGRLETDITTAGERYSSAEYGRGRADEARDVQHRAINELRDSLANVLKFQTEATARDADLAARLKKLEERP